jgi:hypothetical protein
MAAKQGIAGKRKPITFGTELNEKAIIESSSPKTTKSAIGVTAQQKAFQKKESITTTLTF